MAYQQTEDTIPQEFICPLTLEVMDEPVMNRAGHSYEQSAIVEWLTQSQYETCPLTRKEMKISDFVSNRFLQKKIRAWRQEQGEDLTDSETESSDDDMADRNKVTIFMSLYERARKRSIKTRKSKSSNWTAGSAHKSTKWALYVILFKLEMSNWAVVLSLKVFVPEYLSYWHGQYLMKDHVCIAIDGMCYSIVFLSVCCWCFSFATNSIAPGHTTCIDRCTVRFVSLFHHVCESLSSGSDRPVVTRLKAPYLPSLALLVSTLYLGCSIVSSYRNPT